VSTATRNFRLLLAHRVSTRTLLFIPYAFHFLTAVRGLDAFEYGLIMGVFYTTCVLLEVPSGVVADRLGRRPTLVLGALFSALGCVAFAQGHGFWLFALAEVCLATSTALVSGADSALLYDSLAAEGRETEYLRMEGAAQASWLVSSAVGLPLADLFLVQGDDPTAAVWATAALASLGVLAAFAMVEPPLTHRLSAREITRGAARDVAGIPGLLHLIIYSISVFVLLRIGITLYYNPVLTEAGVPIHRWGSILAAVNLAGGIAAWRAHRLIARLGERFVIAAMPVALGGMYAVMVWVQVPLVASLFVLQSLALGLHPVVVRNRLNRLVPGPERRATTLSIESLCCRLAVALAAVPIGWVLGAFGLSWALVTGIALGLAPIAALPWMVATASPPELVDQEPGE
jgi:MFS family permease